MTETRKGIRQSEFVQKHGIPPLEVKAFRDKHLSADEWWKDGVAIVWNPEAAARIDREVYGIIPNKDLEVVQEVLTVYVLKPCRNARYVYASLDGNRISVSVHQRQQKKLIRKNIRVRVEKEGDSVRYIHIP